MLKDIGPVGPVSFHDLSDLLLQLNFCHISFRDCILELSIYFFWNMSATRDCSPTVTEHSWGHSVVPKWRHTSVPSHSVCLKEALGEGSTHQQIVVLGSRWGAGNVFVLKS